MYKQSQLDCGYRIDILVNRRVPIELKAVTLWNPLFEAQLLSYLRLGGFSVGLLINFNVPLLKDGVRRLIWTRPRPRAEESAVPEVRSGDASVLDGVMMAAVEVHRVLGLGLLRSAYETCLCYEASTRGLTYQRNLQISVEMNGQPLCTPAKVPLIIDDVPVFCSAKGHIDDIQVMTAIARLRQGGWKEGLILDFCLPRMIDGIRRVVAE